MVWLTGGVVWEFAAGSARTGTGAWWHVHGLAWSHESDAESTTTGGDAVVGQSGQRGTDVDMACVLSKVHARGGEGENGLGEGKG